jgi:hypothetical protein
VPDVDQGEAPEQEECRLLHEQVIRQPLFQEPTLSHRVLHWIKFFVSEMVSVIGYVLSKKIVGMKK